MAQKFGVNDLRGVVAVTPTPALPGAGELTGRDTVDLEETDRMIRRLIADGVDGIITNGTLGEMATLTLTEWQAFTRRVSEVVSEVAPDLPLFIGATTLNTRDTVDRIRFLEGLGIQGVFLGRPMWGGLGADTMAAFYRDIADTFPDMAIVLYDNPEALQRADPITGLHRARPRCPRSSARNTLRSPRNSTGGTSPRSTARCGCCRSKATGWRPTPSTRTRRLVAGAATRCAARNPCSPSGTHSRPDTSMRRDSDPRIDWTYEPFLARTNFPEFSKYNVTLEKLRFDEAGYINAGPARPPFLTAPEAYAEGRAENGRRWRPSRRRNHHHELAARARGSLMVRLVQLPPADTAFAT
uniref:Hydratase-aldolase n=1 Tax=Rhodococcus opacus TaxID=37919 RepID=Q76BV5_RHOOP|nr:hydratase-aldolase [Rhodococcus opacus]